MLILTALHFPFLMKSENLSLTEGRINLYRFSFLCRLIFPYDSPCVEEKFFLWKKRKMLLYILTQSVNWIFTFSLSQHSPDWAAHSLIASRRVQFQICSILTWILEIFFLFFNEIMELKHLTQSADCLLSTLPTYTVDKEKSMQMKLWVVGFSEYKKILHERFRISNLYAKSRMEFLNHIFLLCRYYH